MQLTIVGPNLIDQSKGTFHVHTKGCADLRKGQYRMLSRDAFSNEEHESVQSVVESFYGPDAGSFYEESFGDDIPEDAWKHYEGDFWFAPCTEELAYADPRLVRYDDKWQTIEQLVARMPGGHLIGDTWKDEPLVDVIVFYNNDDVDPEQDYSFRSNVLIAARREYGERDATPDDTDIRGAKVLAVHPIVEDMLTFWQDGDYSYWIES